MDIVNVILPDGTTYQTAEAAPSAATNVVTTVQHETVHQTDEIEVENVFDVVHDDDFDVADANTVADPNVRSQQNFDAMPLVTAGMKFYKSDHANDNDNTDDSSSISMYRTIYIEPPPNKPNGYMSPTLFSSGSICTVGEGAFAYIPYDATGRQKTNCKYVFGRSLEIGDRSHDNDGLLMQEMTREVVPGGFRELVHRVHISPEPSDAAILIESEREPADYITIYGSGPTQPKLASDALFRVTYDGDIVSKQMKDMVHRIGELEIMCAGLQEQLFQLSNQ